MKFPMKLQEPLLSVSSSPSLHSYLLSSSLSSLLLSPSNLHLVSSEGFFLPTHSLLLTLHSPSLSSLLSSVPPSSLPSLHLPFPALTLSSLLSLLATGESSSPSSFNTLHIVGAAEMLGINLDILQLDNNARNEDEPKILDNRTKTLAGQPSDTDVSLNNIDKSEISDKNSVENNIKYENTVTEEVWDISDIEPFNNIPENKIKRVWKQSIDKETGMFICKCCDYKTDKRERGYEHLRMRHGLKVFLCDKCDYRTKGKGHMKAHMETKHSGIRYDCEECEYQTAHKKDVRRHQLIKHNDGVKPFSCDKCTYKAVSANYINTHKLRRHKSEHWVLV